MYWLILYHIVFFWWAYSKPYSLATSELLSTFFPSWLKGGRTDDYWFNRISHPVLSSFYPFQLPRCIANQGNNDLAYKLFSYHLLLHTMLASCGWYLLLISWFSPLVALFGAITFTYNTYALKQQPCIVYTLAWLPATLLGLSTNTLWLSSLGIGMMLLAGYYPLSIYLLPVAFLLYPQPMPFLLGLVIGSPQIVAFLRYLPKTVRSHSREDVKPGYWEKNFYIGITPIVLLLLDHNWRHLCLLLSLIVLPIIFQKKLPRVYQRFWIVPSYLAIFLSLNLIPLKSASLLVLIQAFDLWRNRKRMVTKPYSELASKPSLAFNNHLTQFLESSLGGDRVSGLEWPLFTGLVNNIKTVGYRGGMRLNLMEKYGEPRKRVRFIFSRKKLDFKRTGFKHLYYNPNYA